MEYKDFEHQLASNLNNQVYLVDTDSLIRGIHGEKEGKRRPMLFLFLLATMLVGVGSWMYLRSSGSTVKSDSHTKEIAMASKTNSETAINETKNTSISVENNESKIEVSNNQQINSNQNSQISRSSFSNINNTSNQSILINQNSNVNNSVDQLMLSDVSKYEELPVAENSPTRQNASGIKSLQQEFQYLTINKRVIRTDKVICPSFKINKGPGISFAIIPEIGAFYPIKRFTSKTQDNAVFQSREDNEKTLEGINGAIYGRAYFGKLRGLYGQVGVSYSTLTEKMKLKYDYEKIDTSFGIISITISQGGDTVTTIYGPIYQRKRITGEKTRHHSFRLWDIPIGVGYDYNLGRINIGVEGGVNVNMSMTPKGTIYQGDTTFVASTDAGNEFKNRLGASFYFGVSASTPISKNGDLYVACRMRYIPDAFTLDNSQISQAYHFTGLNLGYIHRF